MGRPDKGVGLDALAEAARERRPGRSLPPVHLWNPTHCGEIDIVIRRNGQWVHEGAPIGREALVRLFSTVLRRDPDGFHLVTPVEKLKIQVEDAPFVAVAVELAETEALGSILRFTTNVGDEVEADADHPIRIETDPETGAPRPYIHVRRGLDALIGRQVFYDLVEMATEGPTQEGQVLGVTSSGVWFPLGPTTVGSE